MLGIIHIGTEKTGTTSFQRFCRLNSKALLSCGVLYPSQLGGDNHRNISIYALDFDSNDDGVRSTGVGSKEQHDLFRAKTKKILTDQVEAAKDARVCILSSEHLHSRLKTTEHIERVKDLVAPLFESIEIHLHLRPQIDVVTSLASTQTRVGGPVRRAFFDAPKPNQIYYNYNQLTASWERVFGARNVHLLSFQRSPDFLGFMADRLNIDITRLPKPERVNEAIDVRVMAMVNALIESDSSQRIDHRVIDKLPVEQKIRLDETIAREVQGRFNISNQALVCRRADMEAGDLVPVWENYSKEGNLHLLDQTCSFSDALANLVAHYNSLIEE